MAKRQVDLILVDVPYLGAFPVLLGPKNNRPPIVGCGVVPLLMTSVDFGRRSQPDMKRERLLQNKDENRQFEAAFQPATDHINAVLARCGAPPMTRLVFDCMCVLPDLFPPVHWRGIRVPPQGYAGYHSLCGSSPTQAVG